MIKKSHEISHSKIKKGYETAPMRPHSQGLVNKCIYSEKLSILTCLAANPMHFINSLKLNLECNSLVLKTLGMDCI